MASDDEETKSFWDDARVVYIERAIRSAYSDLASDPKFDKLFRTDANW